MTMSLPPKDVQCKCGNTIRLEKKTDWCTKCCTKVFYDPKDQKKAKISAIYMYTVIIGVIFFIAYVFVELIAKPIMTIKNPF
jgi:hypothetical protein